MHSKRVRFQLIRNLYVMNTSHSERFSDYLEGVHYREVSLYLAPLLRVPSTLFYRIIMESERILRSIYCRDVANPCTQDVRLELDSTVQHDSPIFARFSRFAVFLQYVSCLRFKHG